MRAVAYRKSLPIDAAEALLDVELERPRPAGRDLLVSVKAVSVNPVDTKVRVRADPAGEPKVLGYDAAGVVAEVGPGATLFKPGDEVYYAGSIVRPGTNGEFHLVDERIVGRKPSNLDFAQAAAMPLTSITAWELLFDRIGVRRGAGRDRRSILVIGGAGGVGSMAIQLGRRLTSCTVIATASRPETIAWCRELGAHHVIDHRQPFGPQLAALGLLGVDVILGLTGTEQHLPQIAEVIAPQGRLGVIDDPKTLDILPFKRKSVSVHWESMFTRSLFETPDMIGQHELLDEVARLVEDGVLRSTLSQRIGPIDAAHVKRAHALIESGRSLGKIVLEGF
jgi:zinc-binding alcohol dehydrogenase family protein